MAAINFPSGPSVGQIYTTDLGYAFQWDGTVWKNYYAPGIYGGNFSLVTDNSPQLGGHLNAAGLNINNVGILTATSFRGDGSLLTGVSASGSVEVTEITSGGTKSNTQAATSEIQFLNTDFDVSVLTNGRVQISNAIDTFTSIYGISASSYPTINFTGNGVTLSKVGGTITFGASLNSLSDTQDVTNATNGQVLKYSDAIGKWIPQDDSGTGTGTGQVGPDDYVEAAGFAYSSGYWTPTTSGGVTSSSGLTGQSQLSDWIDALNDLLGLLAPPQPPTINTIGNEISLDTDSTSISGQFKLCSGFTYNNFTSHTPSADNLYKVVFSNDSNARLKVTGIIQNIGPGDSGEIAVFLGTSTQATYYQLDSFTFTSANNNGNYRNGTSVSESNAVFKIYDNQDAGLYYNDATDPDRSVNNRAIDLGFYSIYSLDLQIRNQTVQAISSGFQKIAIAQGVGNQAYYALGKSPSTNDSGAVFYYNTNNLSNPTISFGTVNNPTGYTPTRSSGVSHLPSSVSFSYTLNLGNVTGDFYVPGNPVEISSGTICQGGSISYSSLGAVNNRPSQNLGVSSPVQYVYANQVLANTFTKKSGSGMFGTHVLTSPFGSVSGEPAYGSDIVLLYSGDQPEVPSETSGTISSSVGSLFRRVSAGSGADTPTMSSTGATWNSSITVPTYEATLVGGVLGHDLTDYTTGYFPTSLANYSGNDATQYCQFEFEANSIQTFNLNIVGTYSGLWVAMPNNILAGPGGWMSGTLPGWNGWADCFIGFPAGRPGENTLGGATTINPATGTTGTVGVNFGTSSTANSAGTQKVYIRFKFTASQSITSLHIT